MPFLAMQIYDLLDFYDFQQPIATAILGISKISMVNFEIYLFKSFPVTQICALGSW